MLYHFGIIEEELNQSECDKEHKVSFCHFQISIFGVVHSAKSQQSNDGENCEHISFIICHKICHDYNSWDKFCKWFEVGSGKLPSFSGES